MKWEIEPAMPVRLVLKRLEAAGYEAYLAGECVRDCLLGRSPEIWEIAASAGPSETAALFADSGLGRLTVSAQDGTVGLEHEGVCCEIVALGGEASGGDEFVQSLETELGLRHFTVNAMAYSLRRGLLDPFMGREDLRRRRLRCVGDPYRCFEENGLEILRSVRSAVLLGSQLDEEALRAAEHHRDKLEALPADNVRDELWKMFSGKAGDLVNQIRSAQFVFMTILPELKPMVGFEQNNLYHSFDVWQHTLAALAAADSDEIVRFSVLLHDIGKPYCYTEDEGGTGHFYGHSAVSAEIADRVMRRLKFDAVSRKHITELVKYHDVSIQKTHRSLRRWLNRLGREQLQRLLEVRKCDIYGQNPQLIQKRIDEIGRLEMILSEILAEEKVFQVRELAVSGADLIQIGYAPGRNLGETLKKLAGQVADGHVANERNALLEAAGRLNRSRELKGEKTE